MIGKRFHFLLLTEYLGESKYRCLCDCGSETIAYVGNLRKGKTKSCGCWKKMTANANHVSHGMSYSDEYKIWQGIRTRCKNQNSRGYQKYGAAGVTICERWDNSFEAFFADMGPRPSKSHSIDRRDNDGNYEPSNCRWATPQEQSNNTSRNVLIEHNGVTMTTSEFAELTGFTRLTVYRWVTRDKLSNAEIAKKLAARQRANGNKRARCSASDTHPT